jgi:hypothetical protein
MSGTSLGCLVCNEDPLSEGTEEVRMLNSQGPPTIMLGMFAADTNFLGASHTHCFT